MAAPSSSLPGLVALPPLSEGDVSLLEALLRGAGFYIFKFDGSGETSAILFVREKDLERVKTFLSEYRASHPSGPIPIPW